MINKIKSKIKSSNIIKNSIVIFSGQTVSSLISFFSSLMLLQLIGIYGNGVIAIVQSYSNIFNGLFNFQSYNAMIKFGAESLEKNDSEKFKFYMKQAFLQDLISAIVAIIFANIFLNNISAFMGWDKELKLYIQLYTMTILFNITGSVSAFLRLFDRFEVGVLINIKITIIRSVFIILAYFFDLELTYIIIMEIILCIFGNILLFYEGYICLKEKGYNDFLMIKIKFDKEFTMFNLYNNIVSTLDMPTGQLTNIFINKFLGMSEVGVYNILIKFGSLITRVASPITQSLLPELSKMIAKKNYTSAFRISYKIFIYILMPLIFIIPFIILTYRSWLYLFMPVTRYNIVSLILYTIYVFITSSVAPVHLLFVCFNLVKYNLPVVIICNSLYLISMYILTNLYGLIGIIISLIFQAILIVSIKVLILINTIKTNKNMEVD